MTNETNATDPDADTASGGAPEQPDEHDPQNSKAKSDLKDDGSTQHVTDDDGTPVDNPAG